MRQSTKSFLSLAAAGILLYLSFRKLDFREIWASLSQARPFLLAAAVILNALHYLFRAIRWRWLLNHFRPRLALASLLSAIFAGYLVSWILPGRLGEFVRPYLLGRREGISVSGAFSTVVLERFFDLGTVVGLFGIALLMVPATRLDPSAGPWVGQIVRRGWMAGWVVLAGLVVLWMVFRFRRRIFGTATDAAETRFRGWIGKARSWGRGFSEGFGVLSTGRPLLAVIGHSLVLWLVIGLNTWLVLEAFDLEVPLLATFLFLPLPVLGIAVPTPGGLGSFEYLSKLGLQNLFGTPPSEALAASVALHLVSMLPVLLLGPPAVWREGVTLRGIGRNFREKLSAVSPAGEDA